MKKSSEDRDRPSIIEGRSWRKMSHSAVRVVMSAAIVAWCLQPARLYGQTPRPAVSHDVAGSAAQVQPLISKYCVSCHNDRAKTGGLSLQNVDATRPEGNAEVWERVLRKLRSEAMPPVG